MNQLAVVSSPPSTAVIVSISSSFEINGQQVSVTSQDITNVTTGFNFTLAQPVALGSIADFLDWLGTTFGCPLKSDDLDAMIKKLPDKPAVVEDIKNALLGIFHATITITVLSLNTTTGQYRFGVTMSMNPEINILALLKLETIGVELSAGTPLTSP